jgi:hypothetical protein
VIKMANIEEIKKVFFEILKAQNGILKRLKKSKEEKRKI